MEGVLTPEIWIAVAEKTKILELRRTTRDEPDYDKLMRGRLAILDKHKLKLSDIQKVIGTLKPLDVGTEFVFVLSVPSHDKQLELKGEVVWVVTEEQANSESPAGMGIRFRFTDDSERQKVDDFVEKLMDEALGAHISTKLLRRQP